ncbi:hypothetical protein ASG59_18760 [Methylobacterium sp. Leaf466]|nr:hypothetical protein ASG59_18760 [Methylobacterium sp. Leaf466]
MRKINVIEWDGRADLGTQYKTCSITPDDGMPMWIIPPLVVTRRQMILALNAQGKLVEVNTIVASASLTVQLSWGETTSFKRDDPIIMAMASLNDWTDNDLDDLFRLAATL